VRIAVALLLLSHAGTTCPWPWRHCYRRSSSRYVASGMLTRPWKS